MNIKIWNNYRTAENRRKIIADKAYSAGVFTSYYGLHLVEQTLIAATYVIAKHDIITRVLTEYVQ